MQRFPFLIVVASNLFLSGCGHRPLTGESIDEVCHAKNDGKLKSVSGYIGASPVMTSCTTTCTLMLRAQRGAEGREINATFAIGTDTNQLEELPRGFTEESIRIKDHEGKQIKGGDAVRITGRVSVTTSPRHTECTIVATKVESLRGLF